MGVLLQCHCRHDMSRLLRMDAEEKKSPTVHFIGYTLHSFFGLPRRIALVGATAKWLVVLIALGYDAGHWLAHERLRLDSGKAGCPGPLAV